MGKGEMMDRSLIESLADVAAVGFAKFLWNNQKISYNWDSDKDTEALKILLLNFFDEVKKLEDELQAP